MATEEKQSTSGGSSREAPKLSVDELAAGSRTLFEGGGYSPHAVRGALDPSRKYTVTDAAGKVEKWLGREADVDEGAG